MDTINHPHDNYDQNCWEVRTIQFDTTVSQYGAVFKWLLINIDKRVFNGATALDKYKHHKKVKVKFHIEKVLFKVISLKLENDDVEVTLPHQLPITLQI